MARNPWVVSPFDWGHIFTPTYLIELLEAIIDLLTHLFTIFRYAVVHSAKQEGKGFIQEYLDLIDKSLLLGWESWHKIPMFKDCSSLLSVWQADSVCSGSAEREETLRINMKNATILSVLTFLAEWIELEPKAWMYLSMDPWMYILQRFNEL